MMNNQNNTGEHAGRSDAGAEGIDLRDLASAPSPSPSITVARDTNRTDDLLVCGTCRSRLMYPADCEENGRDDWHIELKCPECGGSQWTRFDLDTLDALDRELEQAQEEIETDLARLTRANMADYVTRFVSALDAGAIEPEDFRA